MRKIFEEKKNNFKFFLSLLKILMKGNKNWHNYMHKGLECSHTFLIIEYMNMRSSKQYYDKYFARYFWFCNKG